MWRALAPRIVSIFFSIFEYLANCQRIVQWVLKSNNVEKFPAFSSISKHRFLLYEFHWNRISLNNFQFISCLVEYNTSIYEGKNQRRMNLAHMHQRATASSIFFRNGFFIYYRLHIFRDKLTYIVHHYVLCLYMLIKLPSQGSEAKFI